MEQSFPKSPRIKEPVLKAKQFDYIAIALLLLLGTAHTTLTPLFYHELSVDSLWFAGTGLSFIFLALLNISRTLTTHKTITLMSFIGNIITLAYCLLIVMKADEPQAYLSLFVITSLSVFSFLELTGKYREQASTN